MLDFNKLNNSTLRVSFVSVYLVGMGVIIGQFLTHASAFHSQESRLFYFYAPIWFKINAKRK
ncbi:hypothetical protein, partial [Acinetobacter gandensis]|uniref:hypothetical protein n=1 Tax=Acinetobacter gandensis TaxID=1443941 RepID=UPI003D040578